MPVLPLYGPRHPTTLLGRRKRMRSVPGGKIATVTTPRAYSTQPCNSRVCYTSYGILVQYSSARKRPGPEAVRHGLTTRRRLLLYRRELNYCLYATVCDMKRNFKEEEIQMVVFECRQTRTDQWTKRGGEKKGGTGPIV